MQFLMAMRDLRQRRIRVIIALLISIVFGLEVAYHVSPGMPPKLVSREHKVGVASARVLVDTPSSIVADLNPNGGASLSIHAQLLANFIASGPGPRNDREGRRHPREYAGRAAAVDHGADSHADRADHQRAAGATTVSLAADDTVPIVAINARSATADEAAKVANASVTALRNYLLSIATSQNIRPSARVVLTPLGAAQAITTTTGIPPFVGGVAALFFFGFCCYLITLFTGLRRRLQTAEQGSDSGGPAAADDSHDLLVESAEYDPAEDYRSMLHLARRDSLRDGVAQDEDELVDTPDSIRPVASQ